MAQPFHPVHAVRFDVDQGRVDRGGDAGVLLPATAVAALCAQLVGEAARDFGRQVGTELGRRLGERIGGQSSPAEVVEHLGGELALTGLGSLSIELWGRALVVVVTGSPLGADGDPFLAALVEGALQRLLSRDAAAVPLAREGDRLRLAVVSRPAADRVRALLAGGTSWGDALSRLQAPS